MKNNYRFFNNQACEYFPCHKTEKPEEFNCLFCYCPLYLVDACGGKFKMNGRVKDCSECMIPHHPKGYDYVLTKLKKVLNERKDKGDLT